MKCKRAKQEMALGAGRDLDAATEQDLRRHLASCPSCQEHWNRIRSTTSILHQVSVEETEVPVPRLWSSMSRSIRATSGRQTARSESSVFSHGLVPLVAVASLVLAVVSINHSLNNPPPSQTSLPAFRNAEPARTVEHSIDRFNRRFLDEGGSRFVPPPQSPMQRMLRDREGDQMTPTPPQRRIDSLPGGTYLKQK